MPARHRTRPRTVSRLLLRVHITGAIIAVALAVWASRGAAHRLLVSQLHGDLAARASAFSDLVAGDQFEDIQPRLGEFLALAGLDEAAVFRREGGEEGPYVCIASRHEPWLGDDPSEVALTFFERGDIATLETLIEAAAGEATLAPAGAYVEIALQIDPQTTLYAALATSRVNAQLSAAMWATLWRAALIAAAVAALMLAALMLRAVLPLRRLAAAAEGVAARRSARIDLAGPDEMAGIGASVTALAADADAARVRADAEAQRRRDLFDRIPAPAFILAGAGHILDANRPALDMLGLDLEALRQHQRDELLSEDGGLWLPGGESMPAQWVEAPIEHGDRPATLAVALDLRPLRRAEADLKHVQWVLDNQEALVFELGESGHIESCNLTACRRLKEGIEALRGRPLEEVIDGDPALPPWVEVERAIDRGGVWRGDAALGGVRGEGALTSVEIKAAPDGGFLAVARGIGAQRRLEREIAESHPLTGLGSAAVSFSREIRQGLQSLITYTSYLRDVARGDATLDAGLHSVEAAARRAADQMRRLRLLTREAVYDLQPVDINRVVQREVASRDLLAPDSVTVTLELGDQMRPVTVDASALHHTLRAVLRNALEALPDGGAITVTTRCDEVGEEDDLTGRRARISIHDTGAGMDEETAKRAADPLFTTREGAEGMGLSLAAGLIDLLGGELAIRSTLGEGTTVEISLPLSPEEADRLDQISALERIDVPQRPAPMSEGGTDTQVQELIEDPAPEDVDSMPELEMLEDSEKAPAKDAGDTGDQDPAEEVSQDLDDSPEEEHAEEEIPPDVAAPPEEEPAEEEQTAESWTESSDEDDGEPRMVLLVDDEKIVTDLVCDIFEGEPFEVLVAPDGGEALGLLGAHGHRIFMAIVDLSLPDMSGWELAEALSRHSPGLPIHVASGYDTRSEDIPVECADIVSGLIRKPFRAGALRDLIEEALSRHA